MKRVTERKLSSYEGGKDRIARTSVISVLTKLNSDLEPSFLIDIHTKDVG
jgi:hypothetical protein